MSEVIEGQEVASLPTEQPVKENSDPLLALIERAAFDPAFDPDKLEKLLNQQERILKYQAEQEFNEALLRITKNMPKITKNKSVGYAIDKNNPDKGTKEAFKYVTLEEIDKHVRPLLEAESMSISYDSETKDGGGAVVTATITHIKGHTRKASMPLALDSSGGKNNVQAMGSTMAYGRRYTLCMLLNIPIIGDDNDGAGDLSPINKEQFQKLNDLADECVKKTGENREAMIKRMIKHFEVDDLLCLHAKDFDKAVSTLNLKISLASKPKKEAL